MKHTCVWGAYQCSETQCEGHTSETQWKGQGGWCIQIQTQIQIQIQTYQWKTRVWGAGQLVCTNTDTNTNTNTNIPMKHSVRGRAAGVAWRAWLVNRCWSAWNCSQPLIQHSNKQKTQNIKHKKQQNLQKKHTHTQNANNLIIQQKQCWSAWNCSQPLIQLSNKPAKP